MFESVEVGAKLPKEEYEAAVPQLRVDLLNAQFDLRAADFSVLMLLVGDDRKGCNEVLDLMHEWMDARHMETHVFLESTDAERERPLFWRYWRALPANGRIGIHYGAWVLGAIAGKVLDRFDEAEFEHRINQTRAFEQTLVDEGVLLLKFWLHVPKKELKKRLKKADKDPYVGPQDFKIYENYDEAIKTAESFLRRTDTAWAPWQMVEGTNRRHRNLLVMRRILDAIRRRLESEAPPVTGSPAFESSSEGGALSKVDLSATVEEDDYKNQLPELQERLSQVALAAYTKGVTSVLAFEGWDAAGKGGTIRRLTGAMPAQFYRVSAIAAPTDEERAHHYLWRFWRWLPRAGRMQIFDRSWYGRVLVERVEGYCTAAEWQRAYEEINAFEEQLVSHGIVLAKFWLHLDPEEQARRFEAREATPYKKYKITDEDYRNREKWGAYVAAVNDMVARTSTDIAPWHLVPANDKRYARLYVLRTVVQQLEKVAGRRG